MTIQEAIEYLEHHDYVSDGVKNMCIEALEKQIPRKPRKVTEDEEKNYYCSECKYYLGDEAEIQLCMLDLYTAPTAVKP